MHLCRIELRIFAVLGKRSRILLGWRWVIFNSIENSSFTEDFPHAFLEFTTSFFFSQVFKFVTKLKLNATIFKNTGLYDQDFLGLM